MAADLYGMGLRDTTDYGRRRARQVPGSWVASAKVWPSTRSEPSDRVSVLKKPASDPLPYWIAKSVPLPCMWQWLTPCSHPGESPSAHHTWRRVETLYVSSNTLLHRLCQNRGFKFMWIFDDRLSVATCQAQSAGTQCMYLMSLGKPSASRHI